MILSVIPRLGLAQMDPGEHASHHAQPGAAAPAAGTVAPPPAAAMGGMPSPSVPAPAAAAGAMGVAQPPTDAVAPGPGPGGGMAQMMGEMMTPKPAVGCCGPGSSPTPMYPSLMTLPLLTPEKRAALETMANQQVNEGMAQLAKGSDALARATQTSDDAAMQQSVVAMRDGLNELEAGISAQRVLAEGKAPRNLALDWFKRELNLASQPIRDEKHGLSAFHFLTMGLLIVFAFAMLALYVAKMRRAAALFGRLEPDPQSPPPGSAPPLVGSSGPAAPPSNNPPAKEAKPPAPEAKPPAPEAKPPAPEAKPPAPEAKPPAPEAKQPAPEEAKAPPPEEAAPAPEEAAPVAEAKPSHSHLKGRPHAAPSRRKSS
jgi:hypothetical protein